MDFQDYYKTLGISREASAETVKSAYRRLARKYHPDVSKEADAEERFKAVGEAYEVLRDPQKRAAYDQLGPNWKAGQEFRPPPGWGGFNTGPGHPGGGGRNDVFSDFFKEMFGGFAPNTGPGAQARSRPEPPAPTVLPIEVSLEDAFGGMRREVRLTETGLRNGTGTRTLRVKVPRGVVDGQRIRLSAQGAMGVNGRRSDLLLEIKLKAHEYFTVEGKDVHLILPLTPWEAALGAQVAVPTLGGKVDLRIPAGAKSGAKLRLKGRGLGQGDDAGDQFCVLSIALPPVRTEPEREAYLAMAQAFDFNPRPQWS
ncbi:MAG: DnaJ domain-containing protein [Gammaproteobacteria bacterium]|nr:DnaJ domain-containing protein [Gammaproteobacteria bacterium]